MAARKAAKTSARKATKPKVDLYKHGARVVSVFGPFGSRVLLEMSTTAATEMFSQPLSLAGKSNVIDAVEHDVAEIRARSPDLADSALAASAVALAHELENPYNSATSKANCAKALLEALRELRELAPPKQERDRIDELAARVADGAADPADPLRS